MLKIDYINNESRRVFSSITVIYMVTDEMRGIALQ